MAKLAIVTLYTSNIAYYAEITNINKEKYCEKHGYDLYTFGRFTKLNPNWDKSLAMLEVMKNNYDYVMWMDADAVFINDDIRIEDIIDKNYSFHICFDPAINGNNIELTDFKGLLSMPPCFRKMDLYKIINCGVFICKNDAYCKKLMTEVTNPVHRTINNRNFNGIMEGPLISSEIITMTYEDDELESKCAYNDWPCEQGVITELLIKDNDGSYKVYPKETFNDIEYNVNNLIYHKMGPKNNDDALIFSLFN